MRAFIVDDEIEFAEFVSDALKECGWDTEIADSPETFAARFSNGFDVVFIDMFMPGMDGIEVIRFLADTNATSAVVLMTGKDASVLNAAGEMARRRGVQVLGTLRKPFSLRDVERIVSGFARQSRAWPSGQSIDLQIDDVRRALDDREFYPVYQPQVRLSDGVLCGAEALIRWRHPTLGDLLPSTFIPLIETSDTIAPMTECLVRQVCEDLPALAEVGLERVSINLSAAALNDVDTPEKLVDLLGRNGGHAARIVFEMTETAMAKDAGKASDILTRLRMKGFQLSIDDFGTGYASLEQLVRIPFNELKIDRQFVQGLLESAECRTVVEVCIVLAQKLGLRVVAEGVEDADTLNALRALGADECQGFLISEPLRCDEMLDWARDAAPFGPNAPLRRVSLPERSVPIPAPLG